MAVVGLGSRIVDRAAASVGLTTGSLCMVAIVTGTGLAAISGFGSVDTAAVGSILSPEMRRRGYDIDLAATVVAATGALAPIIQHSITMIIIAITSILSIGAKLLGGILPGRSEERRGGDGWVSMCKVWWSLHN